MAILIPIGAYGLLTKALRDAQRLARQRPALGMLKS